MKSLYLLIGLFLLTGCTRVDTKQLEYNTRRQALNDAMLIVDKEADKYIADHRNFEALALIEAEIKIETLLISEDVERLKKLGE